MSPSPCPVVSCVEVTRRGKHERGQALVETAIVIPVMVFLVLGALQIVLMQHGRIMTEYAAYSAARAGIVHNADWNVMQNAAMIAALPIYGRTDTPARFMSTWAKVKASSEAAQAVDMTMGTLERLAGDLLGVEIEGLAQDVSLIEVRLESPDREAFEKSEAWQDELTRRQTALAASSQNPQSKLVFPDDEIDFDDVELLSQHPELGRLDVEVRVLYPLKIPVVNKIIFELWLAQVLLGAREVRSNVEEWAQLRARAYGGQAAGGFLDEEVAEAPDEGPIDDFFTTRQWVKELRTLRRIAADHDLYLIPLYGRYKMQMQSNVFERNQREPVWFTLD